eukprot:COSAG02_NODE_9688_length_2140_cov_27.903969_1_plen_105_part_10
MRCAVWIDRHGHHSASHLIKDASSVRFCLVAMRMFLQVRGLVDAVESVLSATAAAAGHVTSVTSPSTAQVDDARDRCLSQLEVLRTAAHALPAELPAPPVGGHDT